MTNVKEVKLDPVLLEEVEAHAAAQGAEVEEVLNGLIRVGLDTELAGSTFDRLESLERRLADQQALLNIIGPGVLGTQRIIAHWATKSRDVQTSEETLMAELVSVGYEEFALQASRVGVLVPIGPVVGLDVQPESGEGKEA